MLVFETESSVGKYRGNRGYEWLSGLARVPGEQILAELFAISHLHLEHLSQSLLHRAFAGGL